MTREELMKELQKPFTPDEIEWRVGSTNGDKTKGMALAYVTNRAIQNRLDEVFGPFGWQNIFREWKGTSQICGISVWIGTEWITKWDGADDSQTEAVKGGLSDSMKRAAYQWGIGRYLYKLESTWVDIEPSGKSFKIKREPTLPAWALPEGYTQKPQVIKPETPRAEPPKAEEKPNGNQEKVSTATCSECNLPISPAEAGYSTKTYGKPLCRKHQTGAKKVAS